MTESLLDCFAIVVSAKTINPKLCNFASFRSLRQMQKQSYSVSETIRIFCSSFVNIVPLWNFLTQIIIVHMTLRSTVFQALIRTANEIALVVLSCYPSSMFSNLHTPPKTTWSDLPPQWPILGTKFFLSYFSIHVT